MVLMVEMVISSSAYFGDGCLKLDILTNVLGLRALLVATCLSPLSLSAALALFLSIYLSISLSIFLSLSVPPFLSLSLTH